jgi:hypothetical protein
MEWDFFVRRTCAPNTAGCVPDISGAQRLHSLLAYVRINVCCNLDRTQSKEEEPGTRSRLFQSSSIFFT